MIKNGYQISATGYQEKTTNWKLTTVAGQEFVYEQASQAGGIVAEDAVFFHEIAGNEADFQFENVVAIENNWICSLCAITTNDFWRDRLAIRDNRVNHGTMNVLLDGTKMIAKGEIGSFSRLGHEVGNVDARSLGPHDRVRNFRNQKIGDHAGIERAGAEEDNIGLLNCLDGRGERTDAARVQFNFVDGDLAARDASFALHAFAIGESCDQMYIRKSGRENAATNGEDFGGNANGFGKVSGHVRESGQKEIAEVVSAQATADMKAILKQAA